MSDRAQLGSKVRRLRHGQGVTQVEMAKRLSISPSYLNLIEHNQRPLTRALMMKLVEGFDLDLQTFSDDEDARIVADLDEVLGDSLFAGFRIPRKELSDAVAAAPALGQAMLTLYQGYRGQQATLDAVSERLSDDALMSASTHELRTVLTTIRSFSEILRDYEDLDAPQRQRFLEILVKETGRLDHAVDHMIDFAKGEQFSSLPGAASPIDEVMDFIQNRGNHFPELEQAAEALLAQGGLSKGPLDAGLKRHLEETLGLQVRSRADQDMGAELARFDVKAETLWLSDALPGSSRAFEMARLIGQISLTEAFEEITAGLTLSSPESELGIRRALSAYFAGALLLPYAPFAAAARALRYDVERLQGRFGASFEQVCHRLTCLQRPEDRGIPLHFVRLDAAGNVSKRFSGSGLRIARYGGVCPRWNVHAAFQAPGQVQVQIAEMPGGSRYLCIARSFSKPGGGYGQPKSRFVIGIGCDISHAGEMIYSEGVDLDSPASRVAVGINCRLCERSDCRQRAVPSLIPAEQPGETDGA